MDRRRENIEKVYVVLKAALHSGHNEIKCIIEEKENIMTNLIIICSLSSQDNKKIEKHLEIGKPCKITHTLRKQLFSDINNCKFAICYNFVFIDSQILKMQRKKSEIKPEN